MIYNMFVYVMQKYLCSPYSQVCIVLCPNMFLGVAAVMDLSKSHFIFFYKS